MRESRRFALILGLVLSFGIMATVASAQDEQTPAKQDKKSEKKKKKKKDQGSSSENDSSNDTRNRRAIKELVQDLQDGFEGHSPTRVIQTLDERFYDYPRFEDQVTQFLEQNSEIRMYFRESSTEVKGDKATLIADAEMVFSPKLAPTKELTRRQRIEFHFQRTDKGWKIYDINPRNFFTF